MPHRIFPISENAVTIDFGNEISVELNEKVIELADFITKNHFEGLVEVVPAYSSLTVFFDLTKVRQSYDEFDTAFSFVKTFIENALTRLKKKKKSESRLIKIPVSYSEKFAVDLDYVAQNANLTKKQIIQIHTSKVYRVFMIGFLPAFAYMGEVDDRIATPRKTTPRTRIERGSVGIAGKQTGIYPLESPGGWQIIGKTELEIFKPESEEISLLKTGDLVKFYDIDK